MARSRGLGLDWGMCLGFGIAVVMCAIGRGQVFNGVQINTDANGANITGDAANEPSFAISPVDPNVMVAGWRNFATINSSFRKAGYAFTNDGGLTWTNGGTLVPPQGTSNPQQSDPVLAADRQGSFFYESLMFGSDNGLLVYKSSDGGVSWNEPNFIVKNDFRDKEWYAIDQRRTGLGAGNHYSMWQFPGEFARSTDGGVTWKRWSNGASLYAYIEIDPQGDLHLVWWKSNGVLYEQSTDAKDPSKTPTFINTTIVPLGNALFGLPMNPDGAASMITVETPQAGEPNEGVIYMLASAQKGNDVADVMFSKSVDDGKTWSTPKRINDDSNNRDYQWLAVMSLAPGGRLDAVWYDTRDDPGHFKSRLYYSCSYDGGNTWIPNRPISDQFDTSLGYPQQQKIGDYFQNLSDGGGTNVVYSATFNGEQDIYYLRHHPIDLRVDPLIAGQRTSFVALDGKPNKKAYLIYSLDGEGRTQVNSLNVILDIVNPKLAGKAKTTDSSGRVSWNLPIPAGAKGKIVWFQVAQNTNASNVEIRTVQ